MRSVFRAKPPKSIVFTGLNKDVLPLQKPHNCSWLQNTHPRPSLETEQKMIQFVPMASTVVLIAVNVFRSTATVRDPAICPPSACLERSLIRQMASNGFFGGAIVHRHKYLLGQTFDGGTTVVFLHICQCLHNYKRSFWSCFKPIWHTDESAFWGEYDQREKCTAECWDDEWNASTYGKLVCCLC